MNLTQEVKERALKMGADLAGIASVERFEHAPEDGKPNYYMSDAKSVIVIATRILEGICDVFGSFEKEGKTISPYFWYGYSQLNWANSWIAIQLGKLLEDKGYKAIPFPPTGINYRHLDTNEDIPDFYNKHAAVAAGLGEFGLNRLLLTPQFGAHQRLIPIITNAPLKPDPMYSGPALCRPEKCKKFCIRACPHKALQEKTFSVTIGNRVFEYSLINAQRCKYQRIGGKYMRGKSQFPMNPSDAKLAEIMKSPDGQRQNPHDKMLHMFTPGPSCGECMVKCPSPWR
jgi:epoxyqueuosine reductase